MRLWLVLPCLMLTGAAAAPPASTGADIVAHGAPGGVIPCRVCHGMQLQGNVAIGAPALAGLPESASLPAFAAIAAGKEGKNIAMRHIAATLTSAQRQAIAAYLAGLKKEPAS